MKTFNIHEFGASCEPDVVNTKAIQAAIQACHAAGGGTVYCPPGVFVTGTLWLKSRVTIHLEAGCVLRGSPRRADYEENFQRPEFAAFAEERVSDAHLLIAYGEEEVGICGRGTIDGNSRAFMPFLADPARPASEPWDWRPGQMLFFCRCRRVKVQDVQLLNAPYWTLFLFGCADVDVRGLTIQNPDQTPNGDGIDLDCCRDVTIASCRISTGDDSLTVRANAAFLGPEAPACENITVTNCVLHSRSCGIRMGVGNGLIGHVVFSDLVIRESGMGVNVVSYYPGLVPGGAEIRDIRFQGMTIEAHMPIYISTGVAGTAPVRDIVLSDISARGGCTSYVGGTGDNAISSVTLRNLDLVLTGGASNQPLNAGLQGNPEWELKKQGVPCGLCIVEARDIRIEDTRLRWDDLDGPWQHAVFARNCRGLTLSRFEAASPPAPAGAEAIRCVRCDEVLLRSCVAGNGTGRFAAVSESPAGARVRLLGNDFTQARQALVSDAAVAENGNLGMQAS